MRTPERRARFLCLLNRKGGVGKTTLSIALAETIVWNRSQNVLLVDLDPQGSASEVLLSEEDYIGRSHTAGDRTLAGAMKRLIADERVAPESAIAPMVHALTERAHVRLDLVPNWTAMHDVEFDLPHRSRDRYRRLLKSFLVEASLQYDWVIVDCPPGRTFSVDVAISLADLVLCPVLPDRLSEWGMWIMKEAFERHYPATRWKFLLNRSNRRPEAKRFFARVLDDPTSKLGRFFLGRDRPPDGPQEGVEKVHTALSDSDRFGRRTARFYEKPRVKATLGDLYADSGVRELYEIVTQIELEIARHG